MFLCASHHDKKESAYQLTAGVTYFNGFMSAVRSEIDDERSSPTSH